MIQLLNDFIACKECKKLHFAAEVELGFSVTKAP